MAVVTNVGVTQSPRVLPRPVRRTVPADGRRPVRLAPAPYRPAVRQCAPRPLVGSIGWLVAAGVVAFLVVFGIGWTAGGSDASVPNRTVTVQVHRGETLWSVARAAAPGVSTPAVVDRIRRLNGLSVDQLLYPGELLRVPSGR